MNTYRADKIRATLYDILLGLVVVVFVMLAILSPTLGNSHFYSRYINGNGSVTTSLQDSIKEKTDAIADETGIERSAFDFAVGQKKISSVQKDIINSVFVGNNFDYSDSASIKSSYHDGISEYYRRYGLDLDENALDRAVPMACAAFNEVMGIGNSTEMNKLVTFMQKYSIALAVAMLVAAVLLSLKIFTFHGGRTKMFSHYGSALISAGEAMLLIAVSDLGVHYADRLYLTNNFGFNTAFSSASRAYFIIVAAFAIALIIAGASMIKYVLSYYERKTNSQRQENEINRSLYVKREDGDDKTIEEIVKDRRKETK